MDLCYKLTENLFDKFSNEGGFKLGTCISKENFFHNSSSSWKASKIF